MNTARLLPRLAFPLALTLLPGMAMGYGEDRYVGSVCVALQNGGPTGFVQADASALPGNQYQALFSLLGYTCGGKLADTFALPQLRGHAVLDSGQGVGPPNITLAQKVGQQQVPQLHAWGMTVCIATQGLYPLPA